MGVLSTTEREAWSWEARCGFQGTGMRAHTDDQGDKILLKGKQNYKRIAWQPLNAAAQVAAFSKDI